MRGRCVYGCAITDWSPSPHTTIKFVLHRHLSSLNHSYTSLLTSSLRRFSRSCEQSLRILELLMLWRPSTLGILLCLRSFERDIGLVVIAVVADEQLHKQYRYLTRPSWKTALAVHCSIEWYVGCIRYLRVFHLFNNLICKKNVIPRPAYTDHCLWQHLSVTLTFWPLNN